MAMLEAAMDIETVGRKPASRGSEIACGGFSLFSGFDISGHLPASHGEDMTITPEALEFVRHASKEERAFADDPWMPFSQRRLL